MPATASHATSGAVWNAARGKKGSANRRKPYAPSLSSTAARMTEPPVGASTCASGSQVCSGKSGTLMRKASAKAPKHRSCVPWGSISRDQVS